MTGLNSEPISTERDHSFIECLRSLRKRQNFLFISLRESAYPRISVLDDSLRRIGFVRHISIETSVPFIHHQRGMFLYAKIKGYIKFISKVLRLLIRSLGPVVLNSKKYDILVLGMHPQPVLPILRLFWKKPIVSDAFVSFYLSICFEKNLARPGSLPGNLALWLDRYLLKRSDLILTDTRQHMDFFSNLCPDCKNRILPLWAGVRKSLFNPVKNLDNGPDGRFHVGFVGSFIPFHGVRIIIEAAKILTKGAFFFEIIGDGQEFPQCYELFLRYQLKNVRFHGWGTHDEINRLITASDLVLGIFKSTKKAAMVIPYKVFEGTALGKPVLTGDTPAVRDLFTPDREILVCSLDDPRALAEKIIWCSKNREKIKEIGRRGKEVFIRNASHEMIYQSLKSHLNGIRT